MTRKHNTSRALFLTAVIVLSVFAGTIAFSGSVAAVPAVNTSNSGVSGNNIAPGSTANVSYTVQVTGRTNTNQDTLYLNLSGSNTTFPTSAINHVKVTDSGGAVTETHSRESASSLNITLTDKTNSDVTVKVWATTKVASGAQDGPVGVTGAFSDDQNLATMDSTKQVGAIQVDDNKKPVVNSAIEDGNRVEIAFNEDVYSNATSNNVKDLLSGNTAGQNPVPNGKDITLWV
ncbi:MAG: surface glycoprotein, partial [Salinigranum sp.]